MNTNLYDLLDVPESASEEEIRAAWKTAIADLDPTERRFRAYSDAASVLLDAERRAAYDAELTAERDAAAAADTAKQAKAVPGEPDAPSVAASPAAPPKAAGDGPGVVALAVVAVAAVLSVALAVFLLSRPGADGEQSAKELTARNVATERAALAAEGAAEQMVAPVLSYNHKTMAADLERRAQYMTDGFRAKTERGWPEITKEAETQKVVVEAKAAGTALTRVSADGDRATVVVFIDQYVTKADQEPFVLRMWATFNLVKVAGSESKWLLDDLCTDDSCGG
ncbi:J domain-containing protein [Nocardioides daeguensis]|uniref:J domain-containing protein n=1 Tax=Nocardioides daeguensis TaxID=908359 RepID=A0ABP6V340_9ACTN|nr:DnaJ domain-containing protein [Nocardioides daeguensis]MBV6727088.1 hypothetical protein [Nocardioides daeguensis]MCR1771509.1 hypothetical protein [Nocardioides daeguensis]